LFFTAVKILSDFANTLLLQCLIYYSGRVWR